MHTKCIECGGTKFYRDIIHGELVCKRCALVHPIVVYNEISPIKSINENISTGTIGSTIKKNDKNYLLYKKHKSLIVKESLIKDHHTVVKKINNFSNMMVPALPKDIRTNAFYYYKKYINYFKGKNMDASVLACIIFSLHQYNFNKSWKDIQKDTKINTSRFRLVKTHYYHLKKQEGLTQPQIDHLARFSAKLYPEAYYEGKQILTKYNLKNDIYNSAGIISYLIQRDNKPIELKTQKEKSNLSIITSKKYREKIDNMICNR